MPKLTYILRRLVALGCLGVPTVVSAQAVCLPAPRLLTMMPMGGQAGTQIELTVTGENIEDSHELIFSHPGIVAQPKRNTENSVESNRFTVSIADDVPFGIYEARLMTRLGLSTARVFSVGNLPEVVRDKPNRSLASAMKLKVNSICNSLATEKSIDYYSLECRKGERLVIECAAKGIDSKLHPVLIFADADGRDRFVERRTGVLDLSVPDDGTFVLKVHSLTYEGGNPFFYRLSIQVAQPDAVIARLPATRSVCSFSWPPMGGIPKASGADSATQLEHEPNNDRTHAEAIQLPCSIRGAFAQAADVDVFDFNAKKGEVWWVEVASERLGVPTDPAILVERVTGEGTEEKVADLVELSDIPSPIKPSSNGYSYDGPPYDAGSTDVLGKVEIPETGRYRLSLRDLLGGTRNDPGNVYHLVIRQAEPDFALVAWGLHMELRNGDRAALSKPLTLRRGATIALEVVAVRRDGFDDEIELFMDGLPSGVTATGLKIGKGKSRGILLLTASDDAPSGWSHANFFGRATIAGTVAVRPCRVASMAWPVVDAWHEIPYPRLLADVPVSVRDEEAAPLSLVAGQPPAGQTVWTAKVGETLTIPLVHRRRAEFSGATMQLKVFGDGFQQSPRFEIPLTAEGSEAKLDLAKLNVAPGDYRVAFYGSAVARYRQNVAALTAAELAKQEAEAAVQARKVEVKEKEELARVAPAEAKQAAESLVAQAVEQERAAAVNLEQATKRLQEATEMSQPKDIVDIICSEPITIRVTPAEST